MRLDLDIQRVSIALGQPVDRDFRQWVRAALWSRRGRQALLLRLVDEDEIQALNRDFRGQDTPTNVLSFPFTAPPQCARHRLGESLGDILLCVPVVAREAAERHIPPAAHWAHLVVHGVLHLLGYDHETPTEAAGMEGREIVILARLGLPDPYRESLDA